MRYAVVRMGEPEENAVAESETEYDAECMAIDFVLEDGSTRWKVVDRETGNIVSTVYKHKRGVK